MNSKYMIINYQDSTNRFPDNFEDFSRLVEDQLGHGCLVTVVAVIHKVEDD